MVHNADELEKIMSVGNRNRHIGATAMNIESSRSHAIFSITVESSKKGPSGKTRVNMGKLHLVDLAVSVSIKNLIGSEFILFTELQYSPNLKFNWVLLIENL